jgi:hypothetical protein
MSTAAESLLLNRLEIHPLTLHDEKSNEENGNVFK